MKKNNCWKTFKVLALASVTLSFCMACVSQEKDLYSDEYIKAVIEKSFDFKTTYDCPINVAFDRSVHFEVYENDPTVVGNTEKPFYTSFTDEKGHLNGVMDIPKYLKGKTVYVYTTNLCVRNLSVVTIGEGGINADLTFAALPATRADAKPVETNVIPESVIRGIEATLPEEKDNTKKATYKNANVDVKDHCNVDVIFIHENTSGHNRLEYFFYNTKDYDKIKKNTIKKYLDFDSGGVVFDDVCYKDGLSTGTTVRLQYGGSDVIPAGVSIGWRISQPKEKGPFFYSIDALNDGVSHTIVLQDKAAEMIIFGFEDWNNKTKDLNDVLFCVKANPFPAIDNPDIPETEKPTEELKSFSESGTLMFEDLYPEQGDYDMNDVVVSYTLTKNYSNQNIIRSVDLTIVPQHDGAMLTNGFAFMMDGFEFNQVAINDIPTTTDAGGAVIVYNDNKGVIGKAFNIHFTPQTWDIQQSKVSRSTFNPFIFVGNREDGVEVHLTKKKSSGIVKLENLNELVKQYITSKLILKDMMQWPFAMNIPTAKDEIFRVSKETVRIDTAYPQFEEWVKGFTGNVNFDNQWWKSPNKDQVQ